MRPLVHFLHVVQLGPIMILGLSCSLAIAPFFCLQLGHVMNHSIVWQWVELVMQNVHSL